MSPRYVRIAIDIAESILNKELLVGTKISGRSTLASKYNVSPETIRKAIALLKDYEVVSSAPKNGITILNEDHALVFLKDILITKAYSDIKTEFRSLIDEQSDLNVKMKHQLKLLTELPKKPKHLNRFYPYELTIPKSSILVSKTIKESRFWHFTGATIVSVLRKDKFFISPGPDFKFKADDKIHFVCKDLEYHRVRAYIEKGNS